MAKSISFPLRKALSLFEVQLSGSNPTTLMRIVIQGNIVLAVDEETIETVRAWEEQIDSDKLSSNISKYGLRAKYAWTQ